MPIHEQWRHPLNKRIFNSRADYLDYMRTRRRIRLSRARLDRARAAARDRLRPIVQCSSIEEMNEFLASHLSALRILSPVDYYGGDLELLELRNMRFTERKACWHNAPLALYPDGECHDDVPSEPFTCWEGKLVMRHADKQSKGGIWERHRRYDLPHYQEPRFTDHLKGLGISTGSGSGNSGGLMVYKVYLFAMDFDHMRVMTAMTA